MTSATLFSLFTKLLPAALCKPLSVACAISAPIHCYKPGKHLIHLMMASVAMAMHPSAWPQAYPQRQVTLVVPFSAGALPDSIARALAPALMEGLGQHVAIDYRPGRNTLVGSEFVARSAADGYTLLLNFHSSFAAAEQSGSPFSAARDLLEVENIAEPIYGLFVSTKVRANSLQELIDAMGNGRFNYAHAGEGSVSQLLGNALRSAMGGTLTEVLYRGASAALTALEGGEVELLFLSYRDAETRLREKRIKLLAVAGPTRVSIAMDTPAVSEVLPSFQPPSLDLSVFAPSGTPAAVISRLRAEISKAVASEEHRRSRESNGFNVLTAEQSAAERRRADSQRAAMLQAAAEERARKIRVSQSLDPGAREQAQRLFSQAFRLFQAGEFDAAILGFIKGMAIDPANGPAHYYLAETYVRQKKIREARDHYQATIDFAPDSQEALLAQTRLSKSGR